MLYNINNETILAIDVEPYTYVFAIDVTVLFDAVSDITNIRARLSKWICRTRAENKSHLFLFIVELTYETRIYKPCLANKMQVLLLYECNVFH